MLAKILVFTVAVSAVFCEEQMYYKTVLQHEAQEVGHADHAQLSHPAEPAPIQEVQYQQDADEHTHSSVQGQGQGHGVHIPSHIHYSHEASSQKTEEEYAPIYQYVQAQSEAAGHHAHQAHHAAQIPVHHKTVQYVTPKPHAHAYQPQQYVHLQSLKHFAQAYQPHHQAEEASHGSHSAHESHGAHHAHDSHEEPIDYYAYPKYQYEYKVEDPHTGDNKFQHEIRDGDVVKGIYSFHEADGSIRTVEYTSDKHNGFNAIVKHSAPGQHVEIRSHHKH